MIPPFAAVLLAGGRSRRMGRDKALLPLGDGRLLWQRQLAVLEELQPAELFISGPGRAGFPASVARLEDAMPGLGPLGGIAVALQAMRSMRLLVLAIDLPAMTADFLYDLLVDGRGMIPQTSDGYFEGLAAVYPKTALSAVETQLMGKDRSLQTLIHRLLEDGRVVARPVVAAEIALFENWNQPDDIVRET